MHSFAEERSWVHLGFVRLLALDEFLAHVHAVLPAALLLPLRNLHVQREGVRATEREGAKGVSVCCAQFFSNDTN